MKFIKAKYHYIYKIKNLINNKLYIGRHSTNNLEDKYFGSGKLLAKAIKKYGKDNFELDIIEFCLPCNSHINYREQVNIKYNNCKAPFGYNLTNGGEGIIGFKASLETKALISKNHADVSGKNNPMYGKHFSLEHKNKISNVLRIGYENKTYTPTHKEVLQFTLNGGFVKKWESIKSADGYFSNKGIKQYLHSDKRCSCNGFIWIRNEDYINDISILQKRVNINITNEKGQKCSYCDFVGKKQYITRYHNENCKCNPNKIYVICPFCGKQGNNKHMMERYHFNNCKNK